MIEQHEVEWRRLMPGSQAPRARSRHRRSPYRSPGRRAGLRSVGSSRCRRRRERAARQIGPLRLSRRRRATSGLPAEARPEGAADAEWLLTPIRPPSAHSGGRCEAEPVPPKRRVTDESAWLNLSKEPAQTSADMPRRCRRPRSGGWAVPAWPSAPPRPRRRRPRSVNLTALPTG